MEYLRTVSENYLNGGKLTFGSYWNGVNPNIGFIYLEDKNFKKLESLKGISVGFEFGGYNRNTFKFGIEGIARQYSTTKNYGNEFAESDDIRGFSKFNFADLTYFIGCHFEYTF